MAASVVRVAQSGLIGDTVETVNTHRAGRAGRSRGCKVKTHPRPLARLCHDRGNNWCQREMNSRGAPGTRADPSRSTSESGVQRAPHAPQPRMRTPGRPPPGGMARPGAPQTQRMSAGESCRRPALFGPRGSRLLLKRKPKFKTSWVCKPCNSPAIHCNSTKFVQNSLQFNQWDTEIQAYFPLVRTGGNERTPAIGNASGTRRIPFAQKQKHFHGNSSERS